MSIDLNPQILGTLQRALAVTTDGKGSPNGSNLFQRILESKANSPPPALAQADRLLEMVTLNQLRLGQGWSGQGDAAQQELLPELYGGQNAPLFSLTAGQAAGIYRSVPQPNLREPAAGRQEIDQLIERIAAQFSLAPELIRSVVAAESSYDPRAVSPVGAQGLMQLMPATAQELGVNDSFDPQQNLEGGSRYLKSLLDKYDGDLDHALAAYNWGQGNVDRRGLEQMPTETRNYLARIKAELAG
jgi:soluble lytic murein transglycosylase-like protein